MKEATTGTKAGRKPWEIDMAVHDTFPKLLHRNAEEFGGRTALREKEFGIWNEITWREYFDRVRALALGFVTLGVKRGDKVAIIGDNRPEWVMAELAAQSIGAVPLGVYQDSTHKEVAFVIDHSDAMLVVGEDQEQVDKILEIREEIPKVRHVVYTDPRGLRGYDPDFLLDIEEVMGRGAQLERRDPTHWYREAARGRADDVAIIAYTSGTTGNPKGAMLSHRNMLLMATDLMKVDPKYLDDEFVSFLPLPWMGEQMMAVSSALVVGFTVNFPEEPETVRDNIREIGPHVLFSPPRIWENMAASVQVRNLDATWLKRKVFDLCIPIGYRMADYRFEKRRPPFWFTLLYKLAYIALFRALKDRLGFTRVRSASTGGAALGPDTFRFFHALGVNLKQIYGQTEISGISCIHRDGDVDFTSVGMPIPEAEIVISPEGEILSKSPSVFSGYYKNDQATADTLRDGWLHSGDAGYIDDKGHLVVIDRVKDVMRLSGGTTFSPQFIENKLKFSPYVKEAVVFGQGMDYTVAMINIDFDIVGRWAERRRIAYTTYTDLAAKKEIYDLIEGEVRKVNESLPRAAAIAKFVLLYKELDADDDELTRTKKVRRSFVAERYNEIYEALYGVVSEVAITATIKYQDGRETTLSTVLEIRKMEAQA